MVRGARLALVAAALVALGVPPPPCAGARALEWYTAWVSTAYVEPLSNRTVHGSTESGRYGDSSPKESAQGHVGIPRGASPRHMEGCAPDTDYDVPLPPGGRGTPEGNPPTWIALVARGGCTFKDKVTNAARKRAAAVVIYNEARFGNSTVSMSHLGELPAPAEGSGGSLCLMPARIGDAALRGEEWGCREAEIPVKMVQKTGILFSIPVSHARKKAGTVFCLPSYGPGVREEMRHSHRDRQSCGRLGGRLGFPLAIPSCLVPAGRMAPAVTGRPLSAGLVETQQISRRYLQVLLKVQL